MHQCQRTYLNGYFLSLKIKSNVIGIHVVRFIRMELNIQERVRRAMSVCDRLACCGFLVPLLQCRSIARAVPRSCMLSCLPNSILPLETAE
jgi:hypothetical protein